MEKKKMIAAACFALGFALSGCAFSGSSDITVKSLLSDADYNIEECVTLPDDYENMDIGLSAEESTVTDSDIYSAASTWLIENSKVDVPEEIVDEKEDGYDSRMKQYAKDEGISLLEYKSKYSISDSNITSACEDEAKQELVLEALANDMDISMTEKEYDTYVSKYYSEYGYNSKKDFIEGSGGEDSIKLSYLGSKALAELAEKLKG